MPGLYDLERDALGETTVLAAEPRYRVDQVWEGLYRQLALPDELTRLPKALRVRLAHELPTSLAALTESRSRRGDTVKWLFTLPDGVRIETVLMHYRDRTTVCVSTQAGCATSWSPSTVATRWPRWSRRAPTTCGPGADG